jgi:nucleotide-binding universal stress UspA family protein
MEPLKRMLVASDLSPRAEHALARATLLAREHEAALTVLHVVEPAPPAGLEGWPFLPAEIEAQAAAEASAALEARLAGVPAHIRTRTGKAFVEIIEQARADDCDLIVLGAHGRAFLRDLLLGTTAERVIRKGDRPVLAVKKPAKGPYRRVTVLVDFSKTAQRALAFATRLAPAARFQLMHAYEIWYEGKLRTGGTTSEQIEQLHREYEQKAREQMQASARAAGLDPGTVGYIIRHGYPPTMITHALSENRADLVALGTRGLSGLRYVLLGSVAEHVLRESPCDVLVAHPPATEAATP